MQRYFNTEGRCRPEEHYMVRLDDRLDRIKRLYVDRGKYFVINKGRQYGKTTTLMLLAEYLKKEYLVLSLDFQEIGTEEFEDAGNFVRAFTQIVSAQIRKLGLLDLQAEFLQNDAGRVCGNCLLD